MDHYADNTQRRSPDTYDGALDLAMRYKHLEALAKQRDPRRGFDMQACFEATFIPGGVSHTNWTPQDKPDELSLIRGVLHMAAQDLTRERPGDAAAYWRCWWERRIQDIRPTDRPGGFSRSHVYTVLAVVDAYVDEALYYHDLLTPKPKHEEAMIDPPVVRVFRNPDAFKNETQEEKEEEEASDR